MATTKEPTPSAASKRLACSVYAERLKRVERDVMLAMYGNEKHTEKEWEELLKKTFSTPHKTEGN